MKTIRIFISSHGDVAIECDKARRVVESRVGEEVMEVAMVPRGIARKDAN